MIDNQQLSFFSYLQLYADITSLCLMTMKPFCDTLQTKELVCLRLTVIINRGSLYRIITHNQRESKSL